MSGKVSRTRGSRASQSYCGMCKVATGAGTGELQGVESMKITSKVHLTKPHILKITMLNIRSSFHYKLIKCL